ncbi:MAG TPA: hypothetical protein GXX35_11440 [Thermoanaerobacterales bacterium]|nr:hypothetical protein [Thermoanaerobacterales bacterium]
MSHKELLQQYTDLQAEIKDLEDRIRKLENQADKIECDSVTGSDNNFPYTLRTFHIEGYSYKKQRRLSRLKKLLSKRKEKCEEMKLRIEEFINNIPDSKTRRVFQYRYIDGLSWQMIARRIGKHDESYPRKIIHDKYLENPKNPN